MERPVQHSRAASPPRTPLPNISGLDYTNSPQRHQGIRSDSDVKRAFIASRTMSQANVQTARNVARPSFFQRLQSCCRRSNQAPEDRVPTTLELMGQRVLYHRAWKVLTLVFTIILLFGPPFQSIWSGRHTADLAFDIIYIITLVYFVMDMTLRVIAEPNYLKLNWYGGEDKEASAILNASNRDLTRFEDNHSTTQESRRCSYFTVGSFLFWCDVLSTLTLILNISYINPWHSDTSTLEVTLNEIGRAVGGLGDYRRLRPVRADIDLLITIARSSRISRFIQSRRAMEWSAKVNWFWITNTMHKVNPVPRMRNEFERRRQQRISRMYDEFGDSQRVVESASTMGGSANLGSMSNMRGAPGVNGMGGNGMVQHGSSLLQSGPIGVIDETSLSKPASQSNPWGFIHQGALATIKAQQEAERLAAAQAQVLSQTGFVNVLKRPLRALGILGDDKEAIQRHIAAMKIQRVFRAHMKESQGPIDENASGELESDAWIGRTASNTLERVLHKRSMMRQHMHLNRGTKKRGLNVDILRSTRLRSSRLDGEGAIGAPADAATKAGEESQGASRFQSLAGDGRESQVGCDMRELTGQRVAIGIFLVLVATVVFTHLEADTTRPTAMIVLHQQTSNSRFGTLALDAARNSSVPDLFRYEYANGTVQEFDVGETRGRRKELTGMDILRIAVTDANLQRTVGYFALRRENLEGAITEFVATFFILVVWFLSVTAFSGPVMTLVVIPIERMVRLLGMLMVDPLGYQDTLRFKKFCKEEERLVKNTKWTKELLKGMETSFLMSTILRIGSLMRVGFGSAGVEIIRNNLQKGNSKSMLTLTNRGTTVSCIFLFCDVRSFTDATECLQEEVFVFTNRIAAVVHSKVHSYGGTANKNIGDAFLVSWLLDNPEDDPRRGTGYAASGSSPELVAKHNQADKALLSVVKICIALQYDKYFTSQLSETAHSRLSEKLKDRPGPVVQMGFGLHAGKAVQGAIGSQRKIDATYVSESVERSEFLESSTKAYGLKMLMSNCFHRLLHPSNRKRCRKVDQILLKDDDLDESDFDDFRGDAAIRGDIMELFTFDMDIEALWRQPQKKGADSISESGSTSDRKIKRLDRRGLQSTRQMRRRRSLTIRSSTLNLNSNMPGEEMNSYKSASGSSNMEGGMGGSSTSPSMNPSMAPMHSERMQNSINGGNGMNGEDPARQELVLQHGPIRYTHSAWHTAEMRKIRERYVQGLFFRKFNAGLQTFYNKDWDTARNCFQTILDHFEDGPSRYFMKQIEKHNGTPPPNFLGYGLA